MAQTGQAHRLQLDPLLPVGVIQRAHAARHGGRLPGSVQSETVDQAEVSDSITSEIHLPNTKYPLKIKFLSIIPFKK